MRDTAGVPSITRTAEEGDYVGDEDLHETRPACNRGPSRCWAFIDLRQGRTISAVMSVVGIAVAALAWGRMGRGGEVSSKPNSREAGLHRLGISFSWPWDRSLRRSWLSFSFWTRARTSQETCLPLQSGRG